MSRGTPCVGARAAAPQYFWNGREARQPRAASKPDARGLRASRPDWVWEVGLLTRTVASPGSMQRIRLRQHLRRAQQRSMLRRWVAGRNGATRARRGSVDSALTARHLATGVGKAGAVDTSAGGGVLIAEQFDRIVTRWLDV